MTYPEQLQVLKSKQRKLWEEFYPIYIDLVRCKNGLCKDVSDEDVKERDEKFIEYDQKIKNIEITIQVLREEFHDNQRAN